MGTTRTNLEDLDQPQRLEYVHELLTILQPTPAFADIVKQLESHVPSKLLNTLRNATKRRSDWRAYCRTSVTAYGIPKPKKPKPIPLVGGWYGLPVIQRETEIKELNGQTIAEHRELKAQSLSVLAEIGRTNDAGRIKLLYEELRSLHKRLYRDHP